MSASGSSKLGACCPGCSIATDSIPKLFSECNAAARKKRPSGATYNPPVQDRFLGGLTQREFLRRHWQKRPLCIRNAVPHFAGAVHERQLLRLARRDDVESRI